jgi:DNA-binding MurR/RpiR family transcriptional regulator
MIGEREVTIELSQTEVATVTDALNSPLVEPVPQLFEITRRLENGEPVEAREAVKVVDAIARTLSEGNTEAKQNLIRRIEESMDWRM